MIRKSTATVAICASLCMGLTVAFAAKPRKARVKMRAATGAAVQRVSSLPRFVDPTNPNFPTREQLLEEAAQKFRNLPYEGTAITPNPNATGDELAIHNAVSGLLNAGDFTPPARAAQFAWLKKPYLRQRGWYGQIKSMAPAEGGWAVTITVSPLLDHLGAGKRIITGDAAIESYFFDGQRVKYVGTTPNPNTHHSLILD